MSSVYENFLKDMIKMCETRDVKELDKFIKKWTAKGVYEPSFYDRFKSNDDDTKTATLCKIICNIEPNKLTPSTRNWAKEWLVAHSMSEECY